MQGRCGNGEQSDKPFGYKMVLGEIVIYEQEAVIVRHIYISYIAGKSYGAIADELRCQPVLYAKGKPWNKNMIDRILADRRYAGEKGYPAIITAEMLESAVQQRAARQKPTHQTAAQKVLHRLCGHTVTEKMERQVLKLLGGLAEQPEKIVSAEQEYTPPAEVAVLKEELASTLSGSLSTRIEPSR